MTDGAIETVSMEVIKLPRGQQTASLLFGGGGGVGGLHAFGGTAFISLLGGFFLFPVCSITLLQEVHIIIMQCLEFCLVRFSYEHKSQRGCAAGGSDFLFSTRGRRNEKDKPLPSFGMES